jgi:hypothetical protein
MLFEVVRVKDCGIWRRLRRFGASVVDGTTSVPEDASLALSS